MANKRPLILLSGGLDSAYQLYCTISHGTDVDTLYIAGDQDPLKIEKERQAVKDVLKYILDEHVKHPGWGRVISHREITIKIENYGVSPGFGQPFLWILGIARCINRDIHSEVLLSYVQGDQFCSSFPHLQQAWEHLYIGCIEPTTDNMIPLKAPMVAYVTKGYILTQIPEELLKLVWWCETPVQKGKEIHACGNCLSCIRMEKELFLKKNFRTKTATRQVPRLPSIKKKPVPRNK